MSDLKNRKQVIPERTGMFVCGAKFQTILLLMLTAGLLQACRSSSPVIGEVAVTTGDTYTENKVLFSLAAYDTAGNRIPGRKELKHAYELEVPDSLADSLAYLQIQKLDPMAVIIRGVRLPEEMEERRDVAVVLDIVTAGEENVSSIVAFYQRGVPGGQMLNFQDLLVYYDPEWDGVTPPWFRVRVLDVAAEKNKRTQTFLERSNQLAAKLGGVVPHPVLPSIQTALEAAKLVLGNKKNKIILDYQVQFYSAEQIRGANEQLTPLRKGEWMVIGRPRNQGATFWNEELKMNQRTGEILSGNSGATRQVPYASLVLMSADAAIPKHIMDRSHSLLSILDSSTERKNYDALIETVGSLNSAVEAYVLERRIRKYHSEDDFKDLINIIKQIKDGSSELKIPQQRSLIRLVDGFTDEHLNSASDIITWWQPNATGSFVKTMTSGIEVWKWMPADTEKEESEETEGDNNES